MKIVNWQSPLEPDIGGLQHLMRSAKLREVLHKAKVFAWVGTSDILQHKQPVYGFTQPLCVRQRFLGFFRLAGRLVAQTRRHVWTEEVEPLGQCDEIVERPQ